MDLECRNQQKFLFSTRVKIHSRKHAWLSVWVCVLKCIWKVNSPMSTAVVIGIYFLIQCFIYLPVVIIVVSWGVVPGEWIKQKIFIFCVSRVLSYAEKSLYVVKIVSKRWRRYTPTVKCSCNLRCGFWVQKSAEIVNYFTSLRFIIVNTQDYLFVLVF